MKKRYESIAVGTGTWVIGAVIPKYLSQRLVCLEADDGSLSWKPSSDHIGLAIFRLVSYLSVCLWLLFKMIYHIHHTFHKSTEFCRVLKTIMTNDLLQFWCRQGIKPKLRTLVGNKLFYKGRFSMWNFLHCVPTIQWLSWQVLSFQSFPDLIRHLISEIIKSSLECSFPPATRSPYLSFSFLISCFACKDIK